MGDVSKDCTQNNPIKATGFFVSKDYDKYDWKIEVNPKVPKEEHEFDVIIIGSGLGALSCGALLSKKGCLP